MKIREHKDFLNDIIDSIHDIEQFLTGMSFDDFIKDKKTINAVIRSIEIMGEAARNIPISVKEKHKAIPWNKMSGMRDKLIHGYFGIDNEILWKTAKEDIPQLLHLIQDILANS